MAASLRAGNAGSNTTTDHVEVLTAAIAQVPAARRRNLLIRSDGAGASHGLLDWLTTQNEIRGRSVEYSLGFPISSAVRQAIGKVPKAAWVPAVEADGTVRAGGDVVEVTGLLAKDFVTRWPAGMRVIVRRERPHPGARLSLFEHADGYRYQAFVTSTKVGQIAHLEARHRAHARVEDHIRHAKDTGLGRFPSREFAIDQAWLGCVMLAADLVARVPSAGPARRRHRAQVVRTEGVAVPAVARPRTPDPRRATTTPTHPPVLALDHSHRRRLREHRRHPRPHLTRPPTTPPPHHPKDIGEPQPGSASRHPPAPRTGITTSVPAEHRLTTPMKDRG